MNFSFFFGKRLLSLAFFFVYSVYSNCLYSQETGHPTISNIEVNYMEDRISDLMVDSIKQVRINAHITLKNGVSVTKIHLKIKNNNDEVLYQVAYTTGTEAVIDDAGVALFQKDEHGIIHISSPSLFPLMVYQYEVSTEDGEASESEIYSSIQ